MSIRSIFCSLVFGAQLLLAALAPISYPAHHAEADISSGPPQCGGALSGPCANASWGAVSVMQFNPIANGQSHPLSGRYSTLAAAQAVCPDAGSLSQEIDWCAWDAAIAAVRNSPTGASQPFTKYVYATQGNYYFGTQDVMNLSCMSDDTGTDGCGTATFHGPFYIVAPGAVIQCNATGLPCIYGIGSHAGHIQGLRLIGSCTHEPTVGLMIGRAGQNITADQWVTSGLNISGCFSWAPYYNLASEEFIDYGSIFQNADATVGGGAYAGILDAGNHWNVPSLFGVSPNIATDSNNSFNDPQFYGSQFVMESGATGQALWVYGTRHMHLFNVYANSAGNACTVLYVDASGNAQGLADDFDADFHCESFGSATQQETFFITGAASGSLTPTFKNFHYRDHFNFANSYIFAHDSEISSVLMNHLTLELSNIHATPQIADSSSVFVLLNKSISVPKTLSLTGALMNYGEGFGTLASLTTGENNVCGGIQACNGLTTQANTTAFGYQALFSNFQGSGGNVGVSQGAGFHVTSGALNTFLGTLSGYKVSSGGSNLVLGDDCAQSTLQTGSGNIVLGAGGNTSCDTPSSSTNDTFLVYGRAGSTPLLSGNLASGSLALTLNGTLGIPQSTWTDTQTCTPGQVSVDANYIYVCTAPNTVARAALSSF